jgi:hypothetical protein
MVDAGVAETLRGSDMLTLENLRVRRKSWKQKTKYSGESTLVVLPCNAGGPSGSYFLGSKEHNLWTHVDYCIREWRNDAVLMAVDNAVCWMPGRNDGLGAGQFEWEMSRCMSAWDAGIPTANRFDEAKMKLFVTSLRTLCQRIKLYGFQKVYVILTPLAYRTAFTVATSLEGLPVMCFSAARCGVATVAARLLRCLLLKEMYYSDRSYLVTHEVLEHVPLPKVPEKWRVNDVVREMSVLNLSPRVRQVVGKYSKYYIWEEDWEGMSGAELSDRYLIPVEDEVVFQRGHWGVPCATMLHNPIRRKSDFGS